MYLFLQLSPYSFYFLISTAKNSLACHLSQFCTRLPIIVMNECTLEIIPRSRIHLRQTILPKTEALLQPTILVQSELEYRRKLEREKQIHFLSNVYRIRKRKIRGSLQRKRTLVRVSPTRVRVHGRYLEGNPPERRQEATRPKDKGVTRCKLRLTATFIRFADFPYRDLSSAHESRG